MKKSFKVKTLFATLMFVCVALAMTACDNLNGGDRKKDDGWEMDPAGNMSKYYADSAENADFIIKVNNKSSAPLTFCNLLYDKTKGWPKDDKFEYYTEKMIVPVNGTKEFKYSVDKLLQDFDDNYRIATCYFVSSGNKAWWHWDICKDMRWDSVVFDVTDGDYSHHFEDLTNPVFLKEGYIKLDMSAYAEALAACNYVHIERQAEGETEWKTVLYYRANYGGKLESDVVLTDYYTNKGTKYSYRMNAWAYSNDPIDLGTYTAENGVGEIKITNGKATYDEAEHTLVFTKLPTFEPEIQAGRVDSFHINYTVDLGNNQNGWPYFNVNDIKDNKLPLKKASEVEKYLGKTMVPYSMWYQLYKRIDDNCSIYWRLEVAIPEDDDSYPTITIPQNKADFMHVPPKDLDECFVTSGYDFIYEVVNNLDVPVTVATFISDMEIYDSDGPEEAVMSVTKDVVIAAGESHQFKYKIDALKQKYGVGIEMGCYFEPQGFSQSRGWMNGFNSSIYNQKHTVTLTKTDSWWSGNNSWSAIQ